jgi:hypothetical protein
MDRRFGRDLHIMQSIGLQWAGLSLDTQLRNDF